VNTFESDVAIFAISANHKLVPMRWPIMELASKPMIDKLGHKGTKAQKRPA